MDSDPHPHEFYFADLSGDVPRSANGTATPDGDGWAVELRPSNGDPPVQTDPAGMFTWLAGAGVPAE